MRDETAWQAAATLAEAAKHADRVVCDRKLRVWWHDKWWDGVALKFHADNWDEFGLPLLYVCLCDGHMVRQFSLSRIEFVGSETPRAELA